MKGKRGIRILLVMTMLAVGISLTLAAPDTAAAASKKPGKTKITSCKVQDNTVTLKWKKAKNAKSYRVFVQTGGDKWKYWKKVKKTSANKKKYSNKLKYKLKASGKKYKVYKQKHPFKVAAKKVSKKKRTYTFNGQYGTTYRFAVYAVNGKKLSKVSNIKKAVIPAQESTDPTRETDPDGSEPAKPSEPTNPDGPTQPEQITFNITYVLNGGTNHPDNPSTYNVGDSIKLLDPTKEGYDFKGWFTDAGFTNAIRSISPTMKGNLKLYAKFSLKAINENGAGMEDMIWSWWYSPQVVSEGDKVFWGYATKDAHCGIACYDKTTGETTTTALKQALKTDANTGELKPEVDDHNGLCLTLLEDKRIMCVYAGGHNTDRELHVRISNKPLDISKFDTDIILDSSGATCYGQVIRSNGRYYLFYRYNNTSWAYRSSKDGMTWTKESVLIKAHLPSDPTKGMQYYCKFVPTTDENLIRILMYSNPTTEDPNIRMGFLNTENEYVYNADGKTGVGESELEYTEFKVIQSVEDKKTQRLLDAAVTAPDKPRFLFTSFTAARAKNDCVYYVHDSGKAYEICQGGAPLWDPKYQLGASFVGSDRIVTARNENAADIVDLWSFDGTKVTKIKEVSKHYVDFNEKGYGNRDARPIVDVNGKAILWHRGYYDNQSFYHFDTSAVLYLVDEDKLIPQEEAPEQTEFTISYELNDNEQNPAVNDPANPTSYHYGDTIALNDPTREGYTFLGWFKDKRYSTQVTSISNVFKENLTLYAKWEKQAEPAQNVDLSTTTMAWSLWTYPQVVSSGSKTFWGFITNEGYRGVAMYDESTNKTSATLFEQSPMLQGRYPDTYSPAVYLTPDKKVVVAFAASAEVKKELHVYVSKDSLDINDFNSVTMNDAANAVQYCQLLGSGSDLYLFYRVGTNGSWAYRKSENGGLEWGKEIRFLTESKMQYYCRVAPTTDGTMFRVLMQSNVDADASEIRQAFFCTEDDQVYDTASKATNVTATIKKTGTQTRLFENLPMILNSEPTKTQRLMDIAVTDPAKPRFITASFTYEKSLHDTVLYLNDSGNKMKICDGGVSLIDPKFQQGASFIGNKIVVARNQDGVDYIELYGYDDTKVTLEKEIYQHIVTGKNRAAYPIADINGKALLWHIGRYSSSNDYETYAKLYLMSGKTIE